MKKVKKVREIKSKIKSVRELKKGEKVSADMKSEESFREHSVSSASGVGEILGSVSAAGRGTIDGIGESEGSSQNRNEEESAPRLYASSAAFRDNRVYGGSTSQTEVSRRVVRGSGNTASILGSESSLGQQNFLSERPSLRSADQLTERKIFNDEGRIDRYYETSEGGGMKVKRRSRMF